MFLDRRVPCDLLRLGNQLERRGSQRGHMQRLANMAGGVQSTAVQLRVLVERCSGDKVQKRETTQHGQDAACALVAENICDRLHVPQALSVAA